MLNIKKIILNSIQKHKLEFDVGEMINVIDQYGDKSIMIFLKALVEQYDPMCELFYHTYEKIMVDLKMTNLHGIPYWKKL